MICIHRLSLFTINNMSYEVPTFSKNTGFNLFDSITKNAYAPVKNSSWSTYPENVQQSPIQTDRNSQFKSMWFDEKDIAFIDYSKGKWLPAQDVFQFLQDKKQQAKEWPDLWFWWWAKELWKGIVRAWEQIPSIVWNWLWFVGNTIGEWLDYITPWLWKWANDLWQNLQNIGNDVTQAGMTDGGSNPLTQKQIDMRKLGWQLALTAPLWGGYLAWAKWLWNLAFRSGVVGTWFGWATPIINKGNEATLWDIWKGAAIWWVTGAVAWPVMSKVVAPIIWWVASKTMKYWKAWYYGGIEGAGKSIVRDLQWAWNWIKDWLQKWLQNRADIASTNINRMNAGQIRSFNEEIGVSPWKFLNDRWISDTGEKLVENLSKNLKLSRKSADDGLASIKWNFKAPTQEVATEAIDKETWKYITKQVDPVETMLRDNLGNASSKWMSKESLRAKDLLEKYQTQGLSMSEINEAKRFLNSNNKFSYFSDDTSPRKWFVTNLDNDVRKWQFATAEQQGFSNLKAINMDTKAYYKLMEGIGWWQDKIAGNNPLWLTDWLAFNADPSVFIAKQIAQSNIVKRWYLKGLNALSGRGTQAEVKIPTNLFKDGIHNSNNTGNIPRTKRENVTPTVVSVPSDIPWSSKVTIETPLNPKGNQSKILAWKRGVMVEWQWPRRLLPAQTKTSQVAKSKEINDIKRGIASDTKAAQFWGTWNSRIETKINNLLSEKKITQSEALSILSEIKKSVDSGSLEYSYVKKDLLDEFISDIKSWKIKNAFDDLLNKKQAPEVIEKITDKQIYDKLQKIANDGRFWEKTWNDMVKQFKKQTGMDIMDTSFESFWKDGMITKKPTTPSAPSEPLIVPKKTKNTPIVKPAPKNIVKEGGVIENKIIETLPENINVWDEAKRVGAKRISPDRVAHHKLTPEEWIQWVIDVKIKKANRNAEGFWKMAKQVDELIKKYWEKMPTRLQAEKLNSPTIIEDRKIWANIEANSSSAKTFNEAKSLFERRTDMWQRQIDTSDYFKESSKKEYTELIKNDISKWYKFPDEIIKYDPSFSKAVTSREIYEKWLNTSFGADDSRIVFDDIDSIWAWMKRQDWKTISTEQKSDIINGVKDFSEALGIDMKKLAEMDRWVYVHLNGKNPFLMKDIAWLYRKDTKNNSVSISVWWTESFEKLDTYWRVMKDAEWKIIKEKIHTTVAHELWHAIDYKLDKKLFDNTTINELTELMNKNTIAFKNNRKYYTNRQEVTARMIEQYVAESKWHIKIREEAAQWNKEIFESKIKPIVEKAIKEKLWEFLKPKPIIKNKPIIKPKK